VWLLKQLLVVDGKGEHLDRLSPWAPYVTCGTNYIYEQRFWNPPPQEVSRLLNQSWASAHRGKWGQPTPLKNG